MMYTDPKNTIRDYQRADARHQRRWDRKSYAAKLAEIRRTAAEIQAAKERRVAMIEKADAFLAQGRLTVAARIYRACNMYLWAQACENGKVIPIDRAFDADYRAKVAA